MKEKKKLIAIVASLLLVLLVLGFFIRSVFFAGAGRGTSPLTSSGVVMEDAPASLVEVSGDKEQANQANEDGSQTGGNHVYSTFTLYEQDPVILTGTAQLQTDQAYFYDKEKGDIATVKVRDGQFVKKNDLLYTYEQKAVETQHEIEDLMREQTRTYNQREVLIKQLSDYTGAAYNYQGDRISSYWDPSGKQGYYIEEEIGNYSLADGEANAYTSSDPTVEGMKDQIRQVNEAIEDLEIKLIRLQEKQQGRVLAKSDGTIVLNEEGKDNTQVAFIRIVSDEVSVTGTASEYEFYTLEEGRPVSLYINAEDRDIAGEIISFDQIPGSGDSNTIGEASFTPAATSSEGANFNFMISAAEAIQPGFSVKIGIKLPGVVLPVEAIIEENDQTYVFVNREGVAVKVAVTIERQGTQRVVLRELSAGDILLLNPYELVDGQMVTTDLSAETNQDSW
ncbi:efflux RND transporter periplasmic adaptor subunit [Fundicoccus sp. Sow4_F4]|uniref:efflux RND transporter periplasmic adaptor subunit n=1 Tax=Fundicoccus sp. Sow4_F4 TaxID=3438783 RepID=UPI003F8FE239